MLEHLHVVFKSCGNRMYLGMADAQVSGKFGVC